MKRKSIASPTPEQIAAYAYLTWEQEGYPHGRDVVHWVQAEQQLRADKVYDSISCPTQRNYSKHREVVVL